MRTTEIRRIITGLIAMTAGLAVGARARPVAAVNGLTQVGCDVGEIVPAAQAVVLAVLPCRSDVRSEGSCVYRLREHLQPARETPVGNLWLGVAHRYGSSLAQFGVSTGSLEL